MTHPFDNIEIPESFRVTTGGEEERQIIEARDEFFARVLGSIGIGLTNPFAEVQSRVLSLRTHTFSQQFDPSDDWLHELLVHDVALAVVLDRRTDFNNHEVSFYLNRPGDEALSLLAALQDSRCQSVDNE